MAWGQATPTQPLPTPGQQPGVAPTTPTTPTAPQPDRPTPPRPGDTTIGIDARTTTPTAPGAPTAPTDTVTRPEPISGQVMGPRAISGAGRGAGMGIAGSGQGFEPYLEREIQYRDDEVPPGGHVMTLTTQEGTMGAIAFLDALYLATDWNILVTPEVEPIQMRFWMVEVTPQEALEILKFNGIYYEYNPDTEFIYFMTKEEYLRRRYGQVVREEFEILHTDINDAQAVIQSLASPAARMISDPRTSKVIVWDTLDNIEEMYSALAIVDVPADPVRFTLKNLNADDMVDALFDLLSQRGVAYTDPRTNTLIVEDLPERIKRIEEFIELVDIPHETRRWTLNNIEPGEIANRIEDLVPPGMGDIVIDDRVHQITVTTLGERLDKIDERIKMWDIPSRQVELAAYIIAASKDVTRELGVSWAYFDERSGESISLTRGSQRPNPLRVPDSGQLLQFGTVPYQVPLRNRITGEPITDIAGNVIANPELRMGGLSMVLNYLDQRGDITIMSRPRVTVIDGEEASIQNTTDQPFQEGGFRDSTVGDPTGFSRVIPLRVQFITVGTILRVRPVINEQNNIMLDISAEDSTAESVTVTTGDQASTIPSKTEAKTSTRVMVHNRHTIVIGGLQNAAMSGSEDRMPLLGDLPFVGRLFRNENRERRQRELMIFITPTIVDEFSQPESERLVRMTDELGMELWHSRQSLLRRIEQRLSQGQHTVSITISHAGELRLEGEPVEFIELEGLLSEMTRTARVVVSPHERAPEGIDQAVIDAVERAGLEAILYDERSVFVPYYELPDWARERYEGDANALEEAEAWAPMLDEDNAAR